MYTYFDDDFSLTDAAADVVCCQAGEMEVKNPLFSDDTPAATPNVNQTGGGVGAPLPNGHRTDDDDAAQ